MARECSDLPALPGLRRGARVWLARHGEVRDDWRERAYGDLDAPLGERGLRETELLARAFGGRPLAAVLGSPLSRARALAEAVAAASGAPLAIEGGLRELFRGTWQGRTRAALEAEREDEVRAYHADPWGYRGHGGETDADVYERAAPALGRALDAAPAGELLVATHYNVIRVLVARALGVAPARSFALRVDPGCAVLLLDAAPRWVLCHANVRDPQAAMPEGAAVFEGTGR